MREKCGWGYNLMWGGLEEWGFDIESDSKVEA